MTRVLESIQSLETIDKFVSYSSKSGNAPAIVTESASPGRPRRSGVHRCKGVAIPGAELWGELVNFLYVGCTGRLPHSQCLWMEVEVADEIEHVAAIRNAVECARLHHRTIGLDV